ncbi:MAG: alpha/beta hydrolase [Archangium gephyra]|uniref:Alpha/beta hydrolase n=1 Tax=Archangium gephyra TaxID=48 RepID=A0A2W5TPN1_9BACT|nr:MAG: alpha/beta hydrolase [Archangium gephyra]
MPRHDEGYFASKDGTRLFWSQSVPDQEPKAWLGVVHGYGDHSGRYKQPIDAFVKAGFGVLAFDYRGHGKADGARADVNTWDDYLDDMRAFVARLVDAAKGKPVFIVSHSNGSLIATHLLASNPPAEIKGAVLVAPFYALAFEPPALKLLGARLLKGLLPGLKIGNELKPQDLSRDPAWQAETRADPLYLHHTTPRWFFETQAAQARLAGLGSRITLPVFMVMGSADPVASVPAAKAFFETIGARDKTWKEYGDHRHETLMEIGREQVWDDISRWISAHC